MRWVVCAVHGGINDDIAHNACFDEILYAVKSEAFGQRIAYAGGFFFQRNVINDGYDFHVVGIAERIVCIDAASVATAEKGNFDFFHDEFPFCHKGINIYVL